MNNITKQMINRGSVRKFDTKEIPQAILDDILSAAVHAPTYASAQAYSIIAVTDPAQKEKVVECTILGKGKGMTYIAKAPVFLLFVMDFNRTDRVIKSENSEMQIQNSIESLLVGGVDVGIGLGATTVAAEAHGLGTVVVGAIRANADKLIEIFNLPKYTYPIAGMSIGYPVADAVPVITPRLPLSATVHTNKYSPEGFDKAFPAYNEAMAQEFKSRGMELSWSKLMSTYFSAPLNSGQLADIKKQGFNF